MLVGRRMSKNPVTITPGESLASARAKMDAGKFRRIPVLEDGRLVGIVTDRDLREHAGFLDRTKVNAVMTEHVLTIGVETPLEEAAKLMLREKIGGLPVMEESKVVGIITASDILQAFLDVMGATEEDTVRIDLVLDGEGHDLAEASGIIARAGGEIFGVGTYREHWAESPICYIRMRAEQPERLAEVLKEKGYTVLGLHI
jgi:acetoin utilization protein AcuB